MVQQGRELFVLRDEGAVGIFRIAIRTDYGSAITRVSHEKFSKFPARI